MQQLHQLLRAEKLNGVLVTDRANIRFFSGFTGSSGFLLLTKKKKLLFTDARYHLRASHELRPGFRMIDITGGFKKPFAHLLRAGKIRRLGFEGRVMSMQAHAIFRRAARNVKMRNISEELDALRICKTREELRNIEHAQRITDSIFSKIKTMIKPGQTEKEIAFLIEILAREQGADDISFPPIIAFGKNSAAPHHDSGNRALRRKELVLIDMGVLYKGYCSDMTRVLFDKKPKEKEREVYEIVRGAQLHAMQQIHAGMTGKKIDGFARRFIEKKGYGKQFTHSLGHGVGLEVHERPTLSIKSKEKIPAGTVVTIEPGIYLPGAFGIRIEDMVYVGKNSVQNLTKSPKATELLSYGKR